MNQVAFLSVIAALLLFGCQSVPPEAPAEAAAAPVAPAEPVAAPDPSSVQAGAAGFSPVAPRPANTLALTLHFGHPDTVSEWRLDFLAESGEVRSGPAGTSERLPPTLDWDGRDSDGNLVPEGTYRARLEVRRGESGNPEQVLSESFLVDVTPPSGQVEVSPQPFRPGDPMVMVDPPKVTFQLHLEAGGAAIASWRMGILHPDGRRFFDFISEDHRDNVVEWNGRALNNAPLERGVRYVVEVQIFDKYSNIGFVRGELAIAAPDPEPQATPVTVALDGAVLAATQLYFAPFSFDLDAADPSRRLQNQEALRVLADLLQGASPGSVRIVGHANKVFWQDAFRGDREQKETLVPLSMNRALAVRDALVQKGLDRARFLVSGVGAEGAVAGFGDQRNNWKNRRVELVLEP